MANSHGRLQTIFATLGQCHAALVENGAAETAQLVSVALLQLKMKLHHISDADLKALCAAMMPEEAPRLPKASRGPRRPAPVMLTVVK